MLETSLVDNFDTDERPSLVGFVTFETNSVHLIFLRGPYVIEFGLLRRNHRRE